MKKLLLASLMIMASSAAYAAIPCDQAGPQTPRDIAVKEGTNNADFPWAPAYSEMNLCNIHTHTNAENKGPGFSMHVGDGVHGGYACNETASLTEEELDPNYELSPHYRKKIDEYLKDLSSQPNAHLVDPDMGQFKYQNVKPGDTIEVHWVHSSCDVKPGKGLGSCLSEECTNPKLRVETQVFLLVNDPNALNFHDFRYDAENNGKFHQAKAIPSNTGTPVQFRGSTTGPSYDNEKCSPVKVTWSVRPQCAKLNIASLDEWAMGNVFKETASHGVRKLVTNPALLSPIE